MRSVPNLATSSDRADPSNDEPGRDEHSGEVFVGGVSSYSSDNSDVQNVTRSDVGRVCHGI